MTPRKDWRGKYHKYPEGISICEAFSLNSHCTQSVYEAEMLKLSDKFLSNHIKMLP